MTWNLHGQRLYMAEDKSSGDDTSVASDDDKSDVSADDTSVSDRQTSVMDMSLGDGVPEKFRGKTVTDFASGYTQLEGKHTKSQQKIKELEETIANAVDPVDTGFLRGLLDDGQVSGQISAENRAKAATMMGFTEQQIQMMVDASHTTFTGVMGAAQTMLDEQLGEEGQPSGVDPVALLEWAEKYDGYTDTIRDGFNMYLNEGDLAPFNKILRDMKAAGVDPTDISAGADKSKSKLPIPRKGALGGGGDQSAFKSREEYRDAQNTARGAEDSEAAMAAVEKKLKRSNIKRWPDYETQA